MRRDQYEFGPVERLEPDATGPPEERKFRLLIQRAHSAACLWLDREQLLALAMAIEQLLAGSALSVVWPTPKPPVGWEPVRDFPPPDVELTVGRLALGYDERHDRYPLLVHDVDADQEGPFTFSCIASREQLRALGERIAGAVAGAPPRCPLCGSPIAEPKHSCQGQNGHVAGPSGG